MCDLSDSYCHLSHQVRKAAQVSNSQELTQSIHSQICAFNPINSSHTKQKYQWYQFITMQRSKEMHLKCTCWCSAKSRASSCVSSTLLPMLTDASRTWHRLWLEKQNRYTHAKAQTQFKIHFYLKPGQSLEMLREWWSSISLPKLYFLQNPIIHNPYTVPTLLMM